MDEMYPDSFNPCITQWRMLLLLPCILYTYGLHTSLGSVSGALFAFAFPALFIISGFLVLEERPDRDARLLHAIGRTAVCFVVMLAAGILLSLWADADYTLNLLRSGSFWFDCLLLNIWRLPIGSTVWFVQSLLYAYVIIFLLSKLRLLRFDVIIAALCLVFTLCSGELSALVGFRLFGHTHLGGNFLTRALPYLLLGCFIRRRVDFFAPFALRYRRTLAFAGILLTAAEYTLLLVTGNLEYTGHMLGMGCVAAALCLYCFFIDDTVIRFRLPFRLSRPELMIPFFVCSPIYYLLVNFLRGIGDAASGVLLGFAGPLTMICSVAVVYLYAELRLLIACVPPFVRRIGDLIRARCRKRPK